jgi:3-hydroxyacyl-CoA dehydrogenase
MHPQPHEQSIDSTLTNVAVIGAAGKMGRGISLLLLQEQAHLEASRTGAVGSGHYRITLIDKSEQGLDDLRKYLNKQITSYAEKRIKQLREWYANNPLLISNEEIIEAFVQGAMALIHRSTTLSAAQGAHLIFEAVVENSELKGRILHRIKANSPGNALFFSNTSSIPISEMAAQAQLEGRLIGFHFYNPPAVQKLLELIVPEDQSEGLRSFAIKLATQLGKTVVESKDIAGFIGNGHFLREATFACQQVQLLKEGKEDTQTLSQKEAVYRWNAVTHEQLLRPMGIFQLIDYVGLDVCCSIADIISSRLPDANINIDMVKSMLDRGIEGGQWPDGTQKPGFLEYNGTVPVAIYDDITGNYIAFADAPWVRATRQKIGLGEEHSPHTTGLSWKALSRDKEATKKIESHFEMLKKNESEAAKMALLFLQKSADIADKLVSDGVANSINDIGTVLKKGFFHLYSPNEIASIKTNAKANTKMTATATAKEMS